MRVIPVIDLKRGVVVRGVAGQRERYRAVESILNCDATPQRVAEALVRQFDFQTVYVADLDAIAGTEPNWNAYNSIAASRLRLMVDAGTNSVERASQFVGKSPEGGWCRGVVIGLESLCGERDLDQLCSAIGPEQAIFSLDLRDGKPLTTIPGWAELKPIEVVDAVVNAGFRRLIVLDLASVGVAKGVSVRTLCRTILDRHPELEVTAGGGVRGRIDLVELASAGCDAALVASALHDGSLSKEDLSNFL